MFTDATDSHEFFIRENPSNPLLERAIFGGEVTIILLIFSILSIAWINPKAEAMRLLDALKDEEQPRLLKGQRQRGHFPEVFKDW